MSLDSVNRPLWPVTGDEREVLSTMLGFYRATLAIKCRGLTDHQLSQQSLAFSNLSLLGLLRHLTETERYWFDEIFLGSESAPYYDNTIDPDADFNDLSSDPVITVIERWIHYGATADTIIAEHSLDDVSVKEVEWIHQRVHLRFILVHLIEEYARHCGHADFLREAIDGATGH